MNKLKFRLKEEGKNLLKIAHDPTLLITIIFSIAVVLFFIYVPLYNVLKVSLTLNDGKFGIGNYIESFVRSGNLKIVTNTLGLGIITSVLSLIIGFFFAYLTVYVKFKGKKIFDFIALLPIISPPFAVALSAILLFGRQGLITRKLFNITDFEIYGFHGLVLVQVLSFFPIAYMMLVGLLKMIDPSVEEAAQSLGASKLKVFSTVTLPLMGPGLANAFLLVFIQSIADYANPVVIGGQFTTIAVKIYQEGIGNYRFGLASAMAMILLTISISMFTLQRYYIEKKSYITVTGKASREREQISNPMVVIPLYVIQLLLTLFIVIMYILIPIVSIVKTFGQDNTLTFYHYLEIWRYSNRINPIITTTKLSLVATFIAAIFSMIIAFLIVRKKFLGRTFIEFSVMIGLAIPGTIIGIGYVMSYNKEYFIIPTLTGTGFIIIMAYIIRSLPVGVRTGIAALQQIDPSIEEASSVLGASSSKTFFKITIPMIKEAFLSGLIYSFARSMTLVSTVIFLISAKWKLLTPTIMDNIDQGKIGLASAYCTILIIIVSIFMILMKIIIKLSTKNHTN